MTHNWLKSLSRQVRYNKLYLIIHQLLPNVPKRNKTPKAKLTILDIIQRFIYKTNPKSV